MTENPKKRSTLSPFRLWVQELWFLNKDERLVHREAELRLDEYWNMYKWWLKREYQHRQRKERGA